MPSDSRFRPFRRFLLMTALTTGVAVAAQTAGLPGKGTKVLPLKSSIAEETFQTLLVMKALTQLGYDVQPIKEVEYPSAHIAIGNGDATFLADTGTRSTPTTTRTRAATPSCFARASSRPTPRRAI